MYNKLLETERKRAITAHSRSDHKPWEK